MVLVDAHGIEEPIGAQLVGFNGLIGSSLSEHGHGVQLRRGMELVGASPDLTLGEGPGSEVAGPVVGGFVGVGEHIFGLDGPGVVELVDGIDVVADRRVLQSVLLLVVLVNIVDHAIETIIEHLGIVPLEVTSPENHYFVGSEVLSVAGDEVIPLAHHFVNVVGVHAGVVLEIIPVQIVVEAVRAEVQVAREEVSEELWPHSIRSSHVVRPLDPLELLVLGSLVQLPLVEASEEPGVEAELVEDPGIGVGVAEGINLPAYVGSHSKVFVGPLLADSHVVNHIFESRAGLIVHGPPCVDDFELLVLDEVADLLLLVLRLLLEPEREEFHLYLRELAFGVVLERVNDVSDYEVYAPGNYVLV
uniref:Uncharacterized protein n=1 Tax=Strombidium inclinatum TaxID=197538 RepID=A0A7S3IFY8_9SPIT|mmetsp:Transcript_15058/g.23298  ORF Transcript_15058/g.23298 Transcript_15058/m.23298 type:complete len:360 (+) Transcript_15058:1879-2958(+)